MFNINGKYTIVVENGEIEFVEKDGKPLTPYKDRDLLAELRSKSITLSDSELLPKEVSGCITLASVIDDPTARCEYKWGKWW